MEQAVYQQFYEIERSHWWFVGMREICSTLLKEVRGSCEIKSFRSLDVGCGTGLWTAELERDGRVCGLDYSAEALRFCQKRGLKNLIRATGTSLPFNKDSYNTITALGVIEHLEDDKGFLMELFRVCVPGGYILLLTSAYKFLWSQHDKIVHHKRRYTRGQLRSLLAASGFEPVHISYVNTILFIPILVTRLIQRFLSEKEGTEGSPDLFVPPRMLNRILFRMLWLEAKLINRCSYPFGVGIVVLAHKP
jgi:ubiquinone/menaquinone biosynthesis C-methylase UbiE